MRWGDECTKATLAFLQGVMGLSTMEDAPLDASFAEGGVGAWPGMSKGKDQSLAGRPG